MDKVSCIYCIKHKLDTEWTNIYIGSTNNLYDRKRKHKSNCNHETKYNRKVYQYIRENGGMNNFEFIILEECEVEKLKRLEQSYIDVYKPCLNSKYADGLDIERQRENMKEWYERNKEYKLQQHKEYYQKNKEYIRQQNQKNKKHKSEYNKEWREKNKKHKSEYSKEWREKNKEYMNEKFDCECGGKYTRQHHANHQKTKKHQAYITQSSQNSH
jgi:hypothetical protein